MDRRLDAESSQLAAPNCPQQLGIHTGNSGFTQNVGFEIDLEFCPVVFGYIAEEWCGNG